MRMRTIFILTLASAVCFASTASAQVNWWRVDNNTAVTLEMSKAKFAEDVHDVLGFYNTVGYLGAQVKVSNAFSLIGEIPFASWDVVHPMVFDYDYYFPKWEDQFMIGNIFLGGEYAQPGSSAILRFGVRPPVGSDNKYFAILLGMSAGSDRFEAFYPNMWSASLSGGIRKVLPGGLTYQILLGPTLMAPDRGDAELFGDYSGFFGRYGDKARFGFALHGRFIITESVIDFTDRFDHDLGILAGLSMGMFEPGIQFKYAFDKENRELIDYSYGINIVVNMQPAK